MLQSPAKIIKEVPVEVIAEALGLETNDLNLRDWKPTIMKTEVTHLMVPISDSGKLDKAVSNKTLLKKASDEFGFEGCYCFTLADDDSDFIAESRFFNPKFGIDEDAATGSAAGPLAGFLIEKGVIGQNQDVSVLQGVKLGQPSVIQLRVEDKGIWVSGRSQIVMEGKLFL